jgi:hypothetical protein
MNIVGLATKVGFKAGTCLCGECKKTKFPLAKVGAVRATLKNESQKPEFDLLCPDCAKGDPFADVTVSVTGTIDESELDYLLADMHPGEINIWIRVVPH